MSTNCSDAVRTAKDYYNSDDADNFYFTIWGGEDIHIGLYESKNESIFDASRRTVEHIASLAHNLNNNTHVLDIGAGYGGAARFLAKTYGCKVSALNLSKVENQRDRDITKQQGLDHLIEVVDGNFEDSFHVVWSQDAILHSGNRTKVFQEVVRVLKDGGEFIFTDIMQADDCPEGILQPIYDRIHLTSLGSLSFYRKTAQSLGLEEIGYEDHTLQLVQHYFQVLKETERCEDDLKKLISMEYIQHMKQGLRHWVEGGKNRYLEWGICHFRKV